MYKHPGVYVEHVPSGVLAIEAASTSTACFIGGVPRGSVNVPELVLNRGQYVETFGDLGDTASGIRNGGATADAFGHAVNAFFDNGGRKAYIVPLARAGSAPATGGIMDPSMVSRAFYFEATSHGAWGNALKVTLSTTDPGGNLALGYTVQVGYDILTPPRKPEFVVLEQFDGLSLEASGARFLPAVLADQSRLVRAEHKAISGANGGGALSAIKGEAHGDTIDLSGVGSGKLTISDGTTTAQVALTGGTKTVRVTIGANSHEVTQDEVISSPWNFAHLLNGASALFGNDQLFQAYATGAGEIVILPMPPAPGDSASLTLAGAMRAALKLGAAQQTVLEYPAAGETQFHQGEDGADPVDAAYDAALLALRDVRDASIMILPGKAYDSAGKGAIDKAITHAEFMKNRVVIVDPPSTEAVSNQLKTAADVATAALPTSSFATLYYPWMEVSNPHYDADNRPGLPRTHLVAPSAFAAGLWARTDAARGVWKAPAGLEATLRGAQGPNIAIGNDAQDQLNEWGVNCVRSIIGPPVLWGARTLATKVQPDQRYVPVRRTSILIGESLYNALQAVVFEPNKHTLWASLRASVGDFMDGLYKAGAFQGEKASEAYYVRCGLGSTMTQGDIDAGIVRLVVGYAPLKPAEFVVVQIKQIVGQGG